MGVAMPLTFLRRLIRIPPPSFRAQPSKFILPSQFNAAPRRTFASTPSQCATFNQVLKGCRVGQKARRKVSPQLVHRPAMKGVCLRVGITKPKKPNSGERKIARVRLSNGIEVTAYIPGEGHRRQKSGLSWCQISCRKRDDGSGRCSESHNITIEIRHEEAKEWLIICA